MSGKKVSFTGHLSSKSVIPFAQTVIRLVGDVEVNPGPGGSSFQCGLCEIDVNWSNGGIACKHCGVWYHTGLAKFDWKVVAHYYSNLVAQQ